MAVKVIIKGQKEKEPIAEKSKVPDITTPMIKREDSIIIRVVKIMFMDIRMRLNPALKKDHGDFLKFCELARGKP